MITRQPAPSHTDGPLYQHKSLERRGHWAATLIICLLLLVLLWFVSYFKSSAMEVKNYYLNSKQIFVLKNYENDFKEGLENIANKLSTSTEGCCPSQPCLSLSPPHAASATVFTPKALPVGMTSPTTAGVWALEASWRTNWQEALFFSTGDRTPSNLPKPQDLTDPLLKTGWQTERDWLYHQGAATAAARALGASPPHKDQFPSAGSSSLHTDRQDGRSL